MGVMIPVDELLRCYGEYRPTIYLLRDIESGIITISLSEYRLLPAVFIDMWHMFKLYMAEKRNAEVRRSYGL